MMEDSKVLKVTRRYAYKTFIDKISSVIDDCGINVLNLGSGGSPIRGAINFDRVAIDGVNVLGDLNNGLPFENDSFDLIVAFNVLEHLTVEEFHCALKEMVRVAKPNAIIKIQVPFFASESAFSTIDHKLFFAFNTFLRYRKGDWDQTTEKFFDEVYVKFVWNPHKLLYPINYIVSNIVNLHFLVSMGYQHVLCWIIPMRSLDIVAIVNKEKSR